MAPTNRTLQVNAQTDRIPAVGGHFAIGVHVSAGIQTHDGAFPAIVDDRAYLLPWDWTDRTGQPWNAGQASSWAVFKRAAKGAPFQPVTGFSVATVQTISPDDSFLKKIKDRTAGFEPVDFELPKADAPVTRPTLFGFVGSLPTLPAPYPASLEVWACLVITDATVLDTDQLFALPVFAPKAGGGSYYRPAIGTGNLKLIFQKVEQAGHLLLDVEDVWLQDPLPPDAAGQLIDARTFAVRALPNGADANNNWADATDEDWTATLPDRLASALDPGARLMGVLDASVREFFQSSAAAPIRNDPVKAARAPDDLRRFVDALHWRMLSPATIGGADTTPPAVAVLAAITAAGRLPAASVDDHAAAINIPAALAVLSDRDAYALATPAAATPPAAFHVLSRRRSETLPDLKFAGPPPDPPEAPLEDDATFRTWLLEHWLLDRWPPGQRTPLPAPPPHPLANNATRRLLIARQRRWKATEPVLGPGIVERNIFSLSALSKASDRLDLTMNLTAATPLPTELTLTFSFDGFAAARTPAVKVRIETNKLTLTIVGSPPASIALVGVSAALTLSIAWQADGFGFTASAGSPGNLAVSPKITWPKALESVRGSLEIKSTAGGFADVSVMLSEAALNLLVPRLAATASTQALRAALARGFAGAYLPALLGGEGLPPGTTDPRDRIVQGYSKLVKALFPALFDAAAQAVPGGALPELKPLLETLRGLAEADAVARAAALVPAAKYGGRLTSRAAPLVLPIDQLDPLPAGTDLWSHFSGIAAIVGRASDPTASFPDGNAWYSLNVADLRVRAEAVDGSYPPGSFQRPVDPVPLQIGETSGVRHVTISYAARSLVGQMPSDAVHEQANAPAPGDNPRRVEAYMFNEAARLPALTAGKPYFFFTSLVGLGGALTPLLRASGGDPTTIRSGASGRQFSIGLDQFKANGVDAYIRKAIYLRTTPIGAPRLDIKASTLPGIPPGLSPLASELPIALAPLSLVTGIPATFYLDPAGTSGTLEFPSASAAAVQIDLSPIGSRPAGAATTLSVLGISAAGGDALAPLLEIRIEDGDWPSASDLGLRITAGPAGIALWRQAARSANALREDPLPFEFRRAITVTVPTASWHAFAIRLLVERATGAPAVAVDSVPPVASFGSGQRAATDPVAYAIDNPVAKLPSEAPHHGRDVTVLDGIGKTGQQAVFVLRRPATDFGTWERWINWKLAKKPDGSDPPEAGTIRALINSVYAHLLKDTSQRAANEDVTVDDPAVVAIAAEMLEVFPGQAVLTQPMLLTSLLTDPKDIIDPSKLQLRLPLSVGNAASMSRTDGVTVVAGHVYEIRFYGVIPIKQDVLSDLETDKRIAWPVRQGLRMVTLDGKQYFMGAPLVRTIEVATGEMPDLYNADTSQWPLSIKHQISAHGDGAVVRLTPAYVRGPHQSPPQRENYRLLRYCDRIALFSQQWGWRGRPLPSDLPDIGPAELSAPAQDDNLQFERIAFVDRRDDDVGVIEERRLTLAHLLNDQDDPNGASWPLRAVLFNKDLGYRGGAQWWRFGLKVTSRYAALRPERASLSAYSHRDPAKPASPRWNSFVVCDRPVGRLPGRPAIALVLPLTEPVMEDGVVPPLLALFSEPMFAGGNIADGIEAVVEYARHPLPVLNGQKHWPQYGPDPILTAKGHSGSPVPIRLDGPLGYTFDIATEAGRFNNSGFLVSPVDPQLLPSSLVKLRFRRIEAIELSRAPRADLIPGQAYVISRPDPLPAPVPGDASLVPPEPHEGLVVDLGTLIQSATITVKPARYGDPPPGKTDVDRSTKMEVNLSDGQLVIKLSGDLGGAGTYSCPLPGTASAAMRIVISQQEKPQDGDALYTPVIDVSVRLKITNAVSDGLVRTNEGTWLTVACLPLLAGGQYKPSDSVGVRIALDHALSTAPQIIAARLSAFTPGLWCQFAQDVSRVIVQRIGQPPESAAAMQVTALVAALGTDGKPVLQLRGTGDQLTRLVSLQTDGKAQLSGGVAVVVTRYVTDAFEHQREEPVAVYEVGPGADVSKSILLTPTWPAKLPGDPPTPDVTQPGRIRLVSFMRGTVAGQASKSFPLGFFEDFDQEINMDPSDAPGRVIGVSKPIKWPGAGK